MDKEVEQVLNKALLEAHIETQEQMKKMNEETNPQEEKQTANVAPSALDSISIAIVITAFNIAHSPMMPVLQKMLEYKSFGAFLAECQDSDITFVSELQNYFDYGKSDSNL